MIIETLKKKETIIFSLLVLLGLFVGYRVVQSRTNSHTEIVNQTLMTTTIEKNEPETEAVETKLYVDIKGAVQRPGMYEVTSDMRILNVIDLAGGLSDTADDTKINFAARVEDQMVIYIPKEGEVLSEIEIVQNNQSNGYPSKEAKNEGKINLNLATKEELMRLNGVGEKKAEKIIAYREENGSFKTIEDLKNVNGFGEKSFDSLKEYITI